MCNPTEVDDRIFSTSVNCTYTVNLPAGPLTKSSLANLNVPFDNISSSVRDTTLRIFATDDSASVQATLYKMCEKIIGDNKEVDEVRYELPNKVSLFFVEPLATWSTGRISSCPFQTALHPHQSGLQEPPQSQTQRRRGLCTYCRSIRIDHRHCCSCLIGICSGRGFCFVHFSGA